jgi:hypothetical protein
MKRGDLSDTHRQRFPERTNKFSVDRATGFDVAQFVLSRGDVDQDQCSGAREGMSLSSWTKQVRWRYLIA